MSTTDVIVFVLMFANWTAGCVWVGFVHGWTRRGKEWEKRDAIYKWMHDYANGNATFADAPWRKGTDR